MKYFLGRHINIDNTQYYLEIGVDESGTRQTYILKKDDKELDRRTIRAWETFNIELWASQIHKSSEMTKSTLNRILEEWSGQIDSSIYLH